MNALTRLRRAFTSTIRGTPGSATPPADPADVRMRLDYAEAEIWIRVTSAMERRHRVRNCAKEPWTIQWLNEHVQSGDTLYDIGANVGTFTLVAAIGRGANVVAFEPGYANFARLCENLHLNGCTDRVVPVPLPLAERSGLVRFMYRTTEPGQSRHHMDAGHWKFGRDAGTSRTVQAMCALRLDDARQHFRLPPPAHLKIDVDGAELRVLRGAPKTLQLDTLRTILVEVEPALRAEVESLLVASGFELLTQVAREDAPAYLLFRRRPAAPPGA